MSYLETRAKLKNGLNYVEQTGNSAGAADIVVTNQVTYPQFSGVTVSYDLASTQSPSLTVTSYHYGQLVITMGGTSTLAVRARMADGTTVGDLIATGPTGTKVVMNAAQLVAANNGLYTLDRFDCVDLVFVYTHNANSTIRGRLSGG